MYAGAVAVPLIVGAAFKVSAADMAVLIAADIFTAGIATALIQCIGFWTIRRPAADHAGLHVRRVSVRSSPPPDKVTS